MRFWSFTEKRVTSQKKTKNEALGHLTVYTRDDIERMQAHTLSDLLNTLRSFRYDENMFGMPDVLHQDSSLYSSDLVKIFINNYEITSAYSGSGLYIYGNIDLGFVDHVEIYEGSTSTNVNSEPSTVTIKIYSKDPKRELGGHIQAYTGSRGTNHENVSYGDVSNGLEYFVYGSRTDANRVNYTHQNHDLSRDYKDSHVFYTTNSFE
jgi:iron complex outermembrane receptor protein